MKEQLLVEAPRTMFDKIWDRHEIYRTKHGMSLLYIDRDFVHEGSFHAFEDLRRRDLKVARPTQVFGLPDHYVPTKSRMATDAATPEIKRMIETFDENMKWAQTQYFPLSDIRQGIVHIVGPEQGITLPGFIVVCSDSHTSTHGALGAIAFGVGQSENAHVLATQTLWQRRPKVMQIHVAGELSFGVSAKDVILAIIEHIGASGATGFAIEYTGPVIKAMSIEERLTICNMSIEAGARCGMVEPDEITFEYLKGLPYAPADALWDKAVEDWRKLKSDEGAVFDAYIEINVSTLQPMVTWGTSPEQASPITGLIPDPDLIEDEQKRSSLKSALAYMDLQPGDRLDHIPIDIVFIGSCTNSRLSDLREAAHILQGRKAIIPGMVVPGSGLVKKAAEAEGLDDIFIQAGLSWLEPGCSMCASMNGDTVPAGKRCASTSNRNFAGRQGIGSRTHLLSPAMAAAAAITGRLTDVRQFSKRGVS